MKILAVDDSKTSLMLLKISLEKLGHQVIACSRPLEAITLFQQGHPDLVILDVVMEEMDGYECAKKMRASAVDNCWIPIIFLSAQVDDISIEKGIEAGGDYYLTKPFSETVLRATIKSMQRIAEIQQSLFETSLELKKLNRILHDLSFRDGLTQIHNRRSFDETFLDEWKRAGRLTDENNWISLIMIDIDHFKLYNDTYGHQAGDLCLKTISETLLATLKRDTDFPARYGGEEFIILLPNTNKEQALLIAERLRKAIENLTVKLEKTNQDSHLTISLGVSSAQADYQKNHIRLLNACDTALYESKNNGRNRVTFKDAF